MAPFTVTATDPLTVERANAIRYGAIEILRTDLVRTMRLLGCDSIGQLDRSYIDMPRDWTA